MGKNRNIKKKCFIICPIGELGSDIRRRSDLVLNYVVGPVASELGYTAIRSDEESKPGIITSQIIGHLMSDDLVVADLSFGNPNVYYELAVRHIVRKPVVQIIHTGQPIHFDIITQRTIQFDHKDLESVENCKQKLREQIQSVEKDPTNVDSPISIAIDTKGLLESKNPTENLISRLLVSVQNMQQQIDRISSLQYQSLVTGHVAGYQPGLVTVAEDGTIRFVRPASPTLFSEPERLTVSFQEMKEREDKKSRTMKIEPDNKEKKK